MVALIKAASLHVIMILVARDPRGSHTQLVPARLRRAQVCPF